MPKGKYGETEKGLYFSFYFYSYTLPLEYRISADGRTLQTHTINDKFAQVSDAYYLAERQARQEIEERNKIGKSLAYKDYLKKEEQMREAAKKAREDKNKVIKKDKKIHYYIN